jgi:23S rRNA pseudouridine1911/1915/1917 synthase
MVQTIKHHITIPVTEAGKRLDQVLAELLPAYSRSRLTQWIKDGQVRVNDTVLKPRDKVWGGEQVDVSAQITADAIWQPQAIDLDIVFEDEHVLVVNKPAGLVVHPGSGNPDQTLVNALLHHDKDLSALPRCGIVHRLDKETSGLLVVAKTLPAHTSLVAQLQARTVSRQYEAIVVGLMISGGKINKPIGRHPQHRTKMAVLDEHLGKEAITHLRIAERYRAHTRVFCQLETGRTHQIRVHLAHANFPIVGDPVYGRRLQLPSGIDEALAEALRQFKRQALHARRLSLVHPISGETCTWSARPPEDLQQLIKLLRADAALDLQADDEDWGEV